MDILYMETQHPYLVYVLQLSPDDILLSYFIFSFEGELIMAMPDRLRAGVLPSKMEKLSRKSSYNPRSYIWNGSALRTWKWMICSYHMRMADVSRIWCIIQLYVYRILILFVVFMYIFLLIQNLEILSGFSYKFCFKLLYLYSRH